MTRKGNLETALALETIALETTAQETNKLEKSALETTAQETIALETIAQETIALERTTRKTTAQERQIEMANTHWCSTSSTLWHQNAAEPDLCLQVVADVVVLFDCRGCA